MDIAVEKLLRQHSEAGRRFIESSYDVDLLRRAYNAIVDRLCALYGEASHEVERLRRAYNAIVDRLSALRALNDGTLLQSAPGALALS